MAEYHRLPRTAKLAYALALVRDNPVECPACQTQVDPRQLEQHHARCRGREWGASTENLGWLTSAELGVNCKLLLKWARRKKDPVRRRMVDGRWLYSRSDVEAALTRAEAWHRVRTSARKRRNVGHRWGRTRRRRH